MISDSTAQGCQAQAQTGQSRIPMIGRVEEDTFRVDWSTPANVTDFVMVVGKGWTTGSSSRVVHYVGNFDPNITTYSNTEWQNAYLSLYGWAHHGTEIIEYYVLDGYGEFYQGKPGVDDSYTSIGNTYTSNGSTYHN